MQKFNYAEYEAAGCFNMFARDLFDMGVTPEQAATELDESEGIGHYKATLGYKYCNNDLSDEDVVRILKPDEVHA